MIIKKIIEDEKNLNEEKYHEYEKLINDIINNLNGSKIENKNKILNTIKYYIKDYNEFQNLNIYNNLIWYSEYYEIFQNIFNEKEIKNKIPYLEKINNIEFDTYFNYLTSIFFSDNKFNETEFNSMISTLNAQMLFKIYQKIIKDNLDLLDISNLLFETIQNLDSLINELMERKEKDKNEIIWAYNIISHYPIDFNFILPNFEPKDVKYLFIHLNDNKKNVSEGPLIKNLLFDIELYYHKFYDE